MNGTLQQRWERLTTPFSQEELDFVRENSRLTRKAMLEAFQHRFRRPDVSTWALVLLRRHHGWTRSRRCAPGQPSIALPREYVGPNGYVRVRVIGEKRDGKRTTKTYMKHRLLWEELHGPIPPGMVLRALGPPGNPDPSNWILVSKNVSGHLNRRKAMRFSTLPEELQNAMLALAQFKNTLRGSRVRGRRRV